MQINLTSDDWVDLLKELGNDPSRSGVDLLHMFILVLCQEGKLTPRNFQETVRLLNAYLADHKVRATLKKAVDQLGISIP